MPSRADGGSDAPTEDDPANFAGPVWARHGTLDQLL